MCDDKTTKVMYEIGELWNSLPRLAQMATVAGLLDAMDNDTRARVMLAVERRNHPDLFKVLDEIQDRIFEAAEETAKEPSVPKAS